MKLRNLFFRQTTTLANNTAPTVMMAVVPLPEEPAPYQPGDAQRISIGEDVLWDTDLYPHLLITGPAETGKTTLQRRIIEHCIQHGDQWRVYGMDLSRKQFSSYVEHGAPVEHIAQTVSESIRDLRLIHDEMMRRLIKMRDQSLTSYRELVGELPAVMVVVDETYHVLPVIMTPAERAAAEFDVRIEALNILKELTSHGARAGIHISMATRVPAYGITGDLWKNLNCRVVTAPSGVEVSTLVLGDETASLLDAGESYIQRDKEGLVFRLHQ